MITKSIEISIFSVDIISGVCWAIMALLYSCGLDLSIWIWILIAAIVSFRVKTTYYI